VAEAHPRHIQTASLVDLLDRVLGRGAAVSGDLIIALAGIDLLRLDLRLLLAPIDPTGGPAPRLAALESALGEPPDRP
jgi:hypothetical protein